MKRRKNAGAMDFREYRRATVALRLNGYQRDHHIVFGKDMMNLNGEAAG
jgi:hypothetical protein